MKISKDFEAALNAGMCAAPFQLEFENRLCADWQVSEGDFYWACAWPEHQSHWHGVPGGVAPVRVGNNWVFFKAAPRGAVTWLTVVVNLDNVLLILSPLADCPVDVSTWADTFHKYRAYKDKRERVTT